ncbi:MAG: hypothetical protein HYY28_14160 [Betaproteobacteria bacterium]|nr:hypothetical protein [Betaproteobacteria bacterium]MBI2961452.1 hypothetical protein [Betaproteobacteria bacterium]
MNAKQHSALVAALAALAVAGCAATQKMASGPIKAEEVRIYKPEELKEVSYDQVKRLRIQSGSAAAIAATGYPTAAQGIAVLQAEAARLGANGLTDVSCIKNELGRSSPLLGINEPAVICHGNAIRVRNAQR